MQREGETEERNATGASRRDPPIIEGEAKEIAAAANPATGEGSAVAPESSAPNTDATGEREASDEAVAPDEIAAPVAARNRSGRALALIGIPVVLIAGGGTWLATSGARAPADLRAKIVSFLPASAQRALGGAPKTDAVEVSDNKPAAPDKPAVVEAPAPLASAATNATPAAPLSSTSRSTDSSSPAAGADKQSPAAAAPSGSQPSAASNDTATPPTPATKPVATTESQRADVAAQPAAPAVPDSGALAARLEALQTRLDALPAPSPAKSDENAAKIVSLAARIAALEAKLAAPKSDQRAPESRENGDAAGAQSSAARVVVAQALAQSITSGAPLDQNVSALRSLGVSDDRLADFAPYLKAGAPSVAQLSAQWSALRGKIVTNDAPAGGDWSERIMARVQGLVRIEKLGAQSGASSAAVYSRVEAALQRGDFAGAVQQSDALSENAKAAAADWRVAVSQRAKAEAAARAISSDSIAALTRPKS